MQMNSEQDLQQSQLVQVRYVFANTISRHYSCMYVCMTLDVQHTIHNYGLLVDYLNRKHPPTIFITIEVLPLIPWLVLS